MNRPFLAITLGDPAGCGPWVGARAAADRRVLRRCKPLLVGDAWVLHHFVRLKNVRVSPLTNLSDYSEKPGVLNVLHVPHPHIRTLGLGRAQKTGGQSACLAVRAAVDLAQSGKVTAVVTGPVSKESFKAAGVPFLGHTEMLAALSAAGPVEMIMMAESLRTLLVTRHLPLKNVPRALTVRTIVDSVSRADRWARSALGLKHPHWAMCGLNPHAGDNGLLGSEERRVVAPAVAALRRKDILVEGPLPADSVWAKHRAGTYDMVASLYHDQGIIPLKVCAPRSIINATAGLPFVRTSPGHGTAFDLAKGRPPYGQADPEPTVQACLAALNFSENSLGRRTSKI
jgi:4-hydroxythreonine-4-phosphate dehydrogenase